MRRVFTRSFSSTLKAAPVPPPPPPGDKKGGPGPFIFVGAIAISAAYYYYEQSMEETSVNSSSHTPGEKLNTMVMKEELNTLATRLRAVEIKDASKLSTPEFSKPLPPVSAPVTKDVRQAIVDILEEESYDDGSLGPILVRLAWHAAGTYSKETGTGGSEGAGMRFEPESTWGANAGLDIARARLEQVKSKFPAMSYSDLWSLAGTVAIEEMGGPVLKWRGGRKDFVEAQAVRLPDGLLPDSDGRDHKNNPADHLREIFYRMGFNDKEIVCLSGAHALGRCHTDRSGFWGPWTRAPTTFSNEYFRVLVEERWSKKTTHQGQTWNGPVQYEDSTGDLMMLPSDMALVWDEKMRPYVSMYAKDEDLFMKDFGAAWIKLQELGVRRFHGKRRYWLFGPRE